MSAYALISPQSFRVRQWHVSTVGKTADWPGKDQPTVLCFRGNWVGLCSRLHKSTRFGGRTHMAREGVQAADWKRLTTPTPQSPIPLINANMLTSVAGSKPQRELEQADHLKLGGEKEANVNQPSDILRQPLIQTETQIHIYNRQSRLL